MVAAPDGSHQNLRGGITSMTVVVLGWDGLDYELAGEYGLRSEFGLHNTRIEPFTNETIGKPHTYELWPSIITGVHPARHGIHAEEYTHGTEWSNPILNVAQLLSKPIPDAIRWRVGRWLRGQGATFDFETADYYAEQGVDTVFDDRRSFAVAIPNYRTPIDDLLGVSPDRGADLAAFLNIETDDDGRTLHRPATSVTQLEQRLESEVGTKLGAVRAAIGQAYDLIFVWLGYLDTVGHLAPAIHDPDWQRRKYDRAMSWTADISSELDDDDILVCVSDHGLRAGAHTQDAFFGSTDPRVVDGITTIPGVRSGLERVLSHRTDTRDHSVGTDAESASAVRERLERLGYVSES